MTSWPLRIAVLAAAILQIAFPIFVNPFRDGQDSVRAGEASQIEPAGYAFSIWGPIYLLALAYALYQLLPAGRADRATARIAPAALVLYLGSTAWLSVVQWGPLWASMPILALMAACASFALIAAMDDAPHSRLRTAALVLPFALYAGWTLCATFVNIAEVAPQYGFDRFGLSTPVYGVVSILAATALALIVLWRARAPIGFAATIAWAFVAIIVAAQTRGHDERIIVAAGAGLVALALAFAARRLRRGQAAPAAAVPRKESAI